MNLIDLIQEYGTAQYKAGTLESDLKQHRSALKESDRIYDAIIETINSSAAAALGAKGRAVNSDAQREAAKANGAKGGRPRSSYILISDGESEYKCPLIYSADGDKEKLDVWEPWARRRVCFQDDQQFLKNTADGETVAVMVKHGPLNAESDWECQVVRDIPGYVTLFALGKIER
jgi:hypothetical protein